MSHRTQRSKVFGMALVAVLALTAFMAATAHATWLENGVAIASNKLVVPSTHLEAILLVPAQKLEILCLKLVGDDVLLVAGTLTTTGTLLYSECTTKQNGAVSAGCRPKEPIAASGKGKLILHPEKGRTYILFEPNTGLPFTILEFNEETCALAPKNEVKGGVVFECIKLTKEATPKEVESNCATSETPHILKQAPEALFPSDKLFFGLNPAFLDGSANAVLSSGNPFSGDV